ncbi:MAG: VanZ family protein [Muribaculaceae bacterium]|nr:VanZ family protein [Muribaculaceae bacterium]
MKKLSIIPFGLTTLVVVGLILYATLDPNPLPDTRILLFKGVDKVIHALMFFALSMALSFDFCKKKYGRFNPLAVALIIGIISASCGIIIEFAQDAMGLGRSAELNDAIADAIGAFLGSFLWIPFGNRIFS